MTAKRKGRRSGAAASGGFQIGPGVVASLAYHLFDAEGEQVEASEPGAPLTLLIGYGEAAPALERAVEGLSVGESREITLAPDEAFGNRDPDAVIEVDRAELPADVVAGDELSADRADGSGAVVLKVLEVAEDRVVLDTNHPLAGQRVKLRIRVEAARPASADEIARAAERLMKDPVMVSAPLLPAERLLRRRPGEAPAKRDEPPPPPSGRIA
jgi:FKBP-type peptidyl-prolyl cis-trans isomerase SlyD